MKDVHDSSTQEIFNMATEKQTTYRVNYAYAVKGKLRSGALILNCKDIADARELATKQLKEEYDWFQVNSIRSAV